MICYSFYVNCMVDRGRPCAVRNVRTNMCILGNERLFECNKNKSKAKNDLHKVFSQNPDFTKNGTRSQQNAWLRTVEIRQQKCYRVDLVPLIALNLSINILDGCEFKVNTIKLRNR